MGRLILKRFCFSVFCFFALGASVTGFGGVLRIRALDPQGGSAEDSTGGALTITGFAATQPADVTAPAGGPYVYTQAFTVSGFDAETGLAGGSDSLSFDLTYTSSGTKLDFLSSSQVSLGSSAPLTVTIEDIRLLSGTGIVSFSDWNSVLIRAHDDPGETVFVHAGETVDGTVLATAVGDADNAHKTHGISSDFPSITISYDGSGANLGYVDFELKLFSSQSILPRNIDQLYVLASNRFPRTIGFRSTEFALMGGIYVVDENLDFVTGSDGRELREDITYEQFAADMYRYPIVLGKVVNEEKTGRSVVRDAYSQLKTEHPEKAVVAHFNGRNRRPEYQVGAERFFPGHYVYQTPTLCLNDVAETSADTVLQLDDVSSYLKSDDSLIPDMELCLYAVATNGQLDFSHSEYVFAVAADAAANTLTVSRGENASTPLAYTGGQVSIARALAVSGRFLYNFSTLCPKDSRGRTCSEALIDDLVMLFGEGGELEKLDGITFDAASVDAPNTAFGSGNVDLDMDGTPEWNGFEGGVYLPLAGYTKFSKWLRETMGDNFLIQGDSRTPGHHRSFAYYNGIETEGWPAKRDYVLAKRWSTGIARHQFLEKHLHAPSFHHFHVQADLPALKRLYQVAASCLGAGCTAQYRQFLDTGEIVGHTDEQAMGIAFDFSGWLGKPVGEMVRLADSVTNELSGGIYTNLAFTTSTDVTTTDITGLPVSKLQINGIENPGDELYFKVKLRGDPMSGYLDTVPRVCWMTATPTGTTNYTIDPDIFDELSAFPYADTQELYVDADGESYGVYFRWQNKSHVDLEFVIEGHEAVELESLEIYQASDVVYREFENGLVIGNPSLNEITFSLEEHFPGQPFRKISGYMDPATNDGSVLGGSVTIPPLDGLFLIKGSDGAGAEELAVFALGANSMTGAVIDPELLLNSAGQPRYTFNRRTLSFVPLGMNYHVETTTNLVDGAWIPVDIDENLFSSTPDSDGRYEKLVINLPNSGAYATNQFIRFYVTK